LKCDGLFSRCVQHEVDHLNGVLLCRKSRRRCSPTPSRRRGR
jgi:peptide deformylase